MAGEPRSSAREHAERMLAATAGVLPLLIVYAPPRL